MLSLKNYDSKKYSRFRNMCLNITNRCNLSCKYCFVNQNEEDMSFDTAIKAIDFLFINNLRSTGGKGTINFFGGEPLLRFEDLIVPLIYYINENYPNQFNFGITTNGTLLTKEVVDFLYENNITPLLSMDGDKFTQDFNRPCKVNNNSSFDLIDNNIPYLLTKFPDTIYRMTIYEKTCEHLFANILYAESKGFKYFYMTPDTRNNFSTEGLHKLSIELNKYFEYFIGSLTLGVKSIETSVFTDMLLQILQEPSLEINELKASMPRDVMRCGLGTTSASIDPRGRIYACQEQVTNIDSIFYIGDIYNGIDAERHLSLLKKYRTIGPIKCEEPELCSNCAYRNLCYQIQCPSMAELRFNDMLTLPKTLCYWNNQICLLCKQLLSIYNPFIERYLTELVEKEEIYELYNERDILC